MSTIHASPIDQESKQQDSRSSKDDQKQQTALKRQQSKEAEAPVDSGSSLVGGAVAAVQSAVEQGIHMLPQSVQKGAASLQSQANAAIAQAAAIVEPVVESYQQDGIIAAAKKAGGLGAGAVNAATTQAAGAASGAASTLKTSAANTASGIKSSAVNTASGIKNSAASTASGISSSVSSTASNLTASAASVATNLKQKITGAPAEAPAPKKHGRRRRGGRGRGNRKLKTREISLPPAESIADTLGEKAKELKEVVVEELPAAPRKEKGKAAAAGVVGTVRNAVGSVTSGISNTVSGVSNTASRAVADAASTTRGIVAGATASASGLVQGAQDSISSLAASAKGMVAGGDKPDLERRNELPALGTPNTPDTVTRTAGGKLAANPGDQSSLKDKARFAAGMAKDYVADTLDNLSMNADDTKPMESASSSKKGALDNAKEQLDEMKQSVKQGAREVKKEINKELNKGGAEKDTKIKQKQ